MKALIPAAALVLLTGCAQPGGPGPLSSAGAGKQATVCSVVGFRFATKNTSASPKMTVSSDGLCAASFRAADSMAMTMQLMSLPQHGRIVAADPGAVATVRYYPAAGYEGPDSFSVATGSGGASVANFDVAVIRP